MIERWKINDHAVEVRRRPYQRTLRMRVTAEGVLRITCATSVPKREIANFIESNQKFVLAQLEEFRKIQERFPPKRFSEEETLLFLGRERRLLIRPSCSKPKAFMEGGNLVLSGACESEKDRREAVQRFYRNCGRKYLSHRLQFYHRAMGLSPTSVSFRSQSSRWGSCSSAGHISLNWRLIAAPAEVIDYVIVHELAHLRHHDHSPRFWRLVAEFSPRFQGLKRWLEEHQFAFEFLAKKKEKIS